MTAWCVARPASSGRGDRRLAFSRPGKTGPATRQTRNVDPTYFFCSFPPGSSSFFFSPGFSSGSMTLPGSLSGSVRIFAG